MKRNGFRKPKYAAGGLILMALAFSGCTRGTTLSNVAKLEELEKSSKKPSTTAELKAAVDRYEKIVSEKVKDTKQLGTYYKLLAVKYVESEMYGPARDAIAKAVEISPENPALFNIGGIAAARLAKAQSDDGSRNRLYREAERQYLRALELEPGFQDSLYGLSVLYIFELGEPAKAEPLLVKLLDENSKHYDGMFLLARAYVETGRPSKAVALYDAIIKSSAPEASKFHAGENKAKLMGKSDGA